MPNLTTDCILGADFMRLFNVVLHAKDGQIEAEGLQSKISVDIASIDLTSESKGLALPTKEQIDQLNESLDNLLPLVEDALGCTDLVEHVIDVRDAQ